MRSVGATAVFLVGLLVVGGMSANVAADDPYIETTRYDGYIACSAGTAVASIALCALTSLTPANTFDRFVFDFEAKTDLAELVIAMKWSPSTELGQQLELLLENDGCGAASCDYRYGSGSGTGEVVLSITDDNITDPAFEFSTINDTRAFQMRVFADGDATVVVDQDFQIFVHRFYHARAPADFEPFPAS